MSYLSFPESVFIMHGMPPSSAAGGELASIPISLKNVQKLWVICGVHTPTSAQVAVVLQTDSAVGAGSFAVFPATLHNVPIWVNLAADTTDTYARVADGVNYTTAADALAKSIVFVIDPSLIRTTATASTDEDCFRVSFTAVAAGDWVDCVYVIQTRYPQAIPPTFILD